MQSKAWFNTRYWVFYKLSHENIIFSNVKMVFQHHRSLADITYITTFLGPKSNPLTRKWKGNDLKSWCKKWLKKRGSTKRKKSKKRKESAHISNKSTTHLVFKQPVIIATLSFRAMSTYFVVSNDMAHSIYTLGQ